MEKTVIKNIPTILATATLVVVGLLTVALSTNIPSKYLAADLEAADLSAIVKNGSNFWTLLIIFVALCAGYSIYYLFKKKAD